MRRRRMVLGLTAKQRRDVETLMAPASESAHVIRRAHVVLWSADGVAGADIARRLHLSAEAVSRIRRRFLDGGVAGLATRPKGGRTDKKNPTPFAWTKPAQAIIRSHRRMRERFSTAVH